MSNVRRPVAICLVLLWSSVAAATTTYSPPVRSDEGDILGCVAQNLRDVTVAVTAEINNGLGTVVDSATLDVPAGQSRTVVGTASTVFAAYCKFTFDGTAERVRGYIRLFDLGGSDTRLLFPAAEIEGVSARGLKTYSPPLRNESGVLSCVVQNLSDATVEVTAEVESGLGGPVVDSGTMAIPAGRALVVASTAMVEIGAFCTFTFDGSAAAVRGYIQLYDAGGSNTRLLYAASLAGGRQSAGTVTYTVPVRSFADDRLSCIAENLSDATVSVSAELNDGSNTIVTSATADVFAGQSTPIASTRNNVGAGYCKFTFDGSAADVRGYIRLVDEAGSNTRLLFPASGAGGSIVNNTVTYSPPVRSDNGNALSCSVLNLSDQTVEVNAELDDGQGTIVDSGMSVVAAGKSLTAVSTTTAVFGAYCRFTFDGSPSQVRGFIRLTPGGGGGNTLLLYPASGAGPLNAPTATSTPTPTGTAAPSTTATATGTATDTATLAPTETSTRTATEQPIDTPSPAPTATASAIGPPTSTPVTTAVPTDTPTGSPNATGTPAGACVGDCNGDGAVTISELITMVNIALGGRPIEDCPAGDRNGDGSISIDELVVAVSNGLTACPT